MLHKAGEKVSKLAAEVARVSKLSEASAEARFVGATREWLIGGNERAVQIVAVVDAGSTKLMGLYNNALSEIDGKALAAAGARLAKVLQGTLVADSGYSISVRSVTLDGITAADYLSVEPWMWADVSDPLGDLAAGV